jgi:hypothetical protein
VPEIDHLITRGQKRLIKSRLFLRAAPQQLKKQAIED